jgi:hypothetical protein
VDGVAFLVAILLFNGVAIFAPAQVMKADVASHMAGLISGIGLAQLLQNVLGTLNLGAVVTGVEESGEGRAEGEGEGAGDGKSEAEQKKKVFDLWGRKHENPQ